MRIAFVHDYLIQYGGAERVLESISEIWPHAPIYTLVYEPKKVHNRFDKKIIKTSYLQKIPLARSHHRVFPPLMMLATEQFSLDYYDVVISDSSSFAKNVVTNSDTLHISYCHTPMRYAWDDCQYYTQEFGFPGWLKKIVPFFMNYIRSWDFYSSNGVDYFIANSSFVKNRIKKYYQRKAEVINPPINVENFYVSSQEKLKDYFLMVGRMMKYKKMDLVIKAFNEMKLPLKIVGRGPEFKNLKKIAGPTIEFLGRVSDKRLAQIYSETRGFIFPQEEDFGIVAIEALASGRPIISYRAGDVENRIIENRNGIFFKEQTKEEVIKAVKRFREIKFDSTFIRQTALDYDQKIFKEKIKKFVERKYKEREIIINKKNDSTKTNL